MLLLIKTVNNPKYCLTIFLGTDLIRIGYVAYHTAVYDSFPLDKYAEKRETINRIGM